jgi:hypothetical protein
VDHYAGNQSIPVLIQNTSSDRCNLGRHPHSGNPFAMSPKRAVACTSSLQRETKLAQTEQQKQNEEQHIAAPSISDVGIAIQHVPEDSPHKNDRPEQISNRHDTLLSPHSNIDAPLYPNTLNQIRALWWITFKLGHQHQSEWAQHHVDVASSLKIEPRHKTFSLLW